MSDDTQTLVHLETAQTDSIDAWSACMEHVPHELVVVSDGASALKAAIRRHLPRSEIIPRYVNERSAIKLVHSGLIRASDQWRRRAITILERARLRTRRVTMCRNQPDSETSSGLRRDLFRVCINLGIGPTPCCKMFQ